MSFDLSKSGNSNSERTETCEEVQELMQKKSIGFKNIPLKGSNPTLENISSTGQLRWRPSLNFSLTSTREVDSLLLELPTFASLITKGNKLLLSKTERNGKILTLPPVQEMVATSFSPIVSCAASPIVSPTNSRLKRGLSLQINSIELKNQLRELNGKKTSLPGFPNENFKRKSGFVRDVMAMADINHRKRSKSLPSTHPFVMNVLTLKNGSKYQIHLQHVWRRWVFELWC